MAELNVSTMSESDFVLNDGEVTVLVSSLEARVTTQQRQDKSAPPALVARCDVSRTVLKDAKHDGSAGSDSGVELNGAERSTSPAPIVGVATPSGPHLDYDGTSEGGSESSSVLSHTPVRKKISSASSSTSSSTPSRQGHPRSRSVVAASPGTPGGSASSAARSRERSTAARGSSCSRGRQSSALEATPTTACRSSSRAQRSVGGNILMTSSMTGSMTLNSSGSHAANNVRGRGTTRAPATARSVPRCSTTAAAGAMNASTDDGRWPSTSQRPTTLSRVRASSVVSDRKNAVHALTSSSSKNSVNSTNSASTPSPTVESKCEKFCTLPRRRRRRSVEGERTASSQSSRKLKVTLYHETAAQTALTVQDLDDLLEGKACLFRPVDAKEHLHQAVQVDLEREEVVAHMLERRLKAVVDMLGFEHSGSPRSTLSGEGISSTVQTPPKEVDHTAWVRTLELLEQRAAAIKKRDLLQRNEIGRLRFEFEQTDRLRKRLQSQQEETEAETMEMQEFLQVEKSMLAESLKEAENEIQAKQRIVINLNEELERQREECQHLVRISEQRRQENLTLQARVTALEQRSKECLLQQGAAVSGAAVALSALNSRLDELAVELEKSSVDKALSTLTLEAKAVTTRTKEACRPLSVYLENNFQTLDNVTEPELEEEGGGQRDSVNTEHGNLSQLVNSESIQNLSAAIFRRLQEEAVSNEINVTDDAPGHLVDQVLEIDSLVTRVLGAVSDAVNSKKLLATNDSNIAANGSTHESMEKVLNQKVEEHVGASKCNNGLLLNGSNEVSCSDSKGTAVTGRLDAALTPEPVIGAA